MSGARSEFKVREKDYLRSSLSLRQLQALVGRRCASAVPLIEKGLHSSSVHGPQRERRDVLDQNPTAGDCRLGPSRTVSNGIMFQRFKSLPAAPRHDQLGVVVQQEEQIFRLNNCGVRRLPWRTKPQDLASLRVERKELP